MDRCIHIKGSSSLGGFFFWMDIWHTIILAFQVFGALISLLSVFSRLCHSFSSLLLRGAEHHYISRQQFSVLLRGGRHRYYSRLYCPIVAIDLRVAATLESPQE